MRWLVTGGCGFVGSNLVRRALARGAPARGPVHVTNLDALTYAGNAENLADVADSPSYRFVHADVCDEAAVRDAMEGVEVVLHLAAESHVDRSHLHPEDFLRTNVLGTRVLLDEARRAKVRRFVLVSTDEVYGSLGPTGRFTEASPLAPSSPYSASKAGADLLALAWHRTFGMDVVVTRASNNYGPCQFPEKLIPLFVTNALEGEPLPVYGDGQQVRDWLHVEDHCDGILAAADLGRAGEVYNLGGDCEKTNLEITRRILSALGKPETLVRHVVDRPGHDRRYALDSAKAHRDLGWRPRVPFEEGLPRTIAWYRANEGWWRRVKSGEYRRYYQAQYGDRLKAHEKAL